MAWAGRILRECNPVVDTLPSDMLPHGAEDRVIDSQNTEPTTRQQVAEAGQVPTP